MDSTVDVTRSRSQWWRVFVPSIRLVSATIIIGAVGGAIVGGLGGRIAMRILFLTSDDAVKGVTSDDGFEIGRFTLSNTVGLVIVTMFIGVLAALLYLVAHPFVARWGRARVPAMAIFYGVVGGAMLVHTDGVDFKLLEPAVLAIALFVAISAGFGAVVAHLVGLAAADGAWPQRWQWWALGPPMLFLLVPTVSGGRACRVRGAPRRHDHRAEYPMVAGRASGALVVMASLFVLGAIDLAKDAAELS